MPLALTGSWVLVSLTASGLFSLYIHARMLTPPVQIKDDSPRSTGSKKQTMATPLSSTSGTADNIALMNDVPRAISLSTMLPVQNVENTTASKMMVPVFVKLHVVGSTTFTNLLRCMSATGHVEVFRRTGVYYWSTSECGPEQGHETATAFSRGGGRALSCCLDQRVAHQHSLQVRFVTLLRHPVEKFLSSLFTFASKSSKRELNKPPANLTYETLSKD